MKYVRISVFALLLAILACGCDFVRAALGKPTSEDIEAIRQRIAYEEKLRRDSILEAQILYEAQQAELLRQEAVRLRRFNISAGTFKDSLNAESLCAKIAADGYVATVYRYVSGTRFAVLLGGFDDNKEAMAKYAELSADPDFKFDICIYDAKSELDKIQKQTIIQQ